MYVLETKESISLKIILFNFQECRQSPKWLPKCQKFALSLYEKYLNAIKYEGIITTAEKYLFRDITVLNIKPKWLSISKMVAKL